MAKTKTAQPSLEARFHFREDALAPGDRAAFRATLFEVEEKATGRELTLKLWRKSGGQGDADLRELWRHEMRQIARLMVNPGAREIIVDLLELVEDDTQFGLVLERVGQPLVEKRKRVSRDHWLRLLDAPRPRSLLWRNIARLVDALGLIHDQGLMHGALNADNVMTEGAEQPDFQLGGFEWSLSLAHDVPGGSHARVSDAAAILRPPSYSFAEDWRCLGVMVLELLGLKATEDARFGATDGRPVPEASLSLAERQLLKRLLTPTRSDQLDAPAIRQAIDDLLISLARTTASKTGSLILAFDPRAGLGEAVFDATDGMVAIDETGAQLDWVRADFDAGATLLIARDFDPERHTLRLVTTELMLDLRPARSDGSAIWDVAICHRVEHRPAHLPNRGERRHEVVQTLVIGRGARDAQRLKQQLGPDALDWSAFAAEERPGRQDPVSEVQDALFVAQMIEGVVKAAEAIPVEVLERGRENGKPVVALRAQPDSDRDKLAFKLGMTLGEPALARLFDEDGRDPDVRWRLSRSAAMRASRAFDVAVSFVGTCTIKGRQAYRFELDEPLGDEVGTGLFLRPQSDTGSEQVISRRLRLLKALPSRPDLAEILTNPWRARRASGETITAEEREEAAFKALDRPKQDALVAAFEVAPTLLVVGPPGVGKTRLATEVVTRRFLREKSSRILICAQGHDALNHLQGKVQAALDAAGFGQLLVVRSVTPERRTRQPEEVEARVLQLLESLDASDGIKVSPPQLRQRIGELRSAVAGRLKRNETLATRDRIGMGAVANLLIEAADVVISTLNSADIERMVEARDQFDWVIVEEAARATGPELAGALMLSGRRLLIGDHNQLPAFDAERMLNVLADHSLAQMALHQARSLLRPMLDDADQARLAALAGATPEAQRATAERAHRLFAPFEALVREDQERTVAGPGHRKIAETLTEQRRMDPAIAEVVSRAFYDRALTTSQARIEALEREPRRFISLDPLPASPIVVVDFPHVSSPLAGEIVAREAAGKLRNPSEVEAVIAVLKSVRPSPGARPTLAILSPYKAQVEALQSRITAAMTTDLQHLEGFESVRSDGAFVGTVDAFQGNEADLVILSLVRNNARAGLGAVGFLRDRRRMNVAFSRARDQLIIVGSLDFLKEAVRGVNPDGGVHKLDFLTKTVSAIDALSGETRGALPLARRIRPSVLGLVR